MKWLAVLPLLGGCNVVFGLTTVDDGGVGSGMPADASPVGGDVPRVPDAANPGQACRSFDNAIASELVVGATLTKPSQLSVGRGGLHAVLTATDSSSKVRTQGVTLAAGGVTYDATYDQGLKTPALSDATLFDDSTLVIASSVAGVSKLQEYLYAPDTGWMLSSTIQLAGGDTDTAQGGFADSVTPALIIIENTGTPPTQMVLVEGATVESFGNIRGATSAAISADGLTLVYSDGADLYVTSRTSTTMQFLDGELISGAGINTADDEVEPSLTADCTLYFRRVSVVNGDSTFWTLP